MRTVALALLLLLPACSAAKGGDGRRSWMLQQETHLCDNQDRVNRSKWLGTQPLAVYAIVGHHGVSMGMRGDLGINVVRVSDGLMMARIRLDRYLEVPYIIQSVPVIGPPIIIQPGDEIEVLTHCTPFTDGAYVTFATWVEGVVRP